MQKLSVIITNDNITIRFNSDTLVINRIKNQATFEKVLKKATDGDEQWIIDNIASIKDAIESKTNGVLSVDKGRVIIKGTDIPAPALIVKKLMELDAAKEPIEPLLRFWRKLSLNPNEASRNDLFDFMERNNVAITEGGDIVLEKGVRQKAGSFPGDLVDVHTGKFNNSVGVTVKMKRENVDSDNKNQCSRGLHSAAPQYVREWYKNNIIVEVVINPMNVCAVPKDYNATKMRVCEYYVAGYSAKTPRSGNDIVKLSDFLDTPIPEQQELMGGDVKKPKKVVKVKKEDIFDLNGMSAKAIVDMVKEKTGQSITISLKSKKSIVRQAEKILGIEQLKKS